MTARSNSFSNGLISRTGITGPLADTPEVFLGASDPRAR